MAPPDVPPMTPRQIAWRLFFTSWIVFTLHFATDIVREHYPAIAIADSLSFDLKGYCGLHPDLFELPGKGCHIGNNPGVSMLAAIPYALAKPVIDPLVRRVQASRAARPDTTIPQYNTPSPNSRKFYAKVWRMGLDVKLELAAFVMQAFCMAPSSAFAVVVVFWVLFAVLRSAKQAMWLSLLYAFGTPVMFRTGFLNHNLMLGHIAFAGFALAWNPWNGTRLSDRWRDFICGIAGGATILFDYTGVVFIVGLGLYVVLKRWGQSRDLKQAVRAGAWYTLGTLGPVFLLWFYQYEAFGNPFLPGQNWMPPVQWIDRGYQGYQFPPVPEILGMLLFDYRFGLFLAAPVLVLSLAVFFVERGVARRVPALELWTMMLLALGTWLFFGGNNYTRLQFNTGIRYLTCIFPFLFIPAALVLSRMRLATAYAWALAGIAVAWPMAMYRRVQMPLGLFDPIVRTFTSGFTIPVLHTLSLTEGQYGDFTLHGTSPIPLFLITGAVLWALWSPRFRRPPKIPA